MVRQIIYIQFQKKKNNSLNLNDVLQICQNEANTEYRMSRQLSGKYILIGQFSKGTLCAKVQEITQQMFLNSKFGEV